MRRTFIMIALAACTLAGVYIALTYYYEFNFHLCGQIPFYFWVIGFGFSFMDVFLRSLSLKTITYCVGERISVRQALKITFNIDFFAAMTPARVGGDAARFVGLKKLGVSSSRASLALAIEFFIDLVYIGMGIICTIYFAQADSSLLALFRTIMGLILVIFLIFTTLLIMNEKHLRVVFEVIAKKLPLLYRLLSGFGRWIPESILISFRQEVLATVKKLRWFFILTVVITLGWWVMRFSSLLWLSHALHFKLSLSSIFFPQFILFQSLVYTPLPGSGGVFEGTFMLIYKDLIPASVLPLSMLLWRFFTYYVFVIVGVFSISENIWRYLGRKAPLM